MISNSIAVTFNLSYYRTFVPLILQVYLSMDLADMTLLKAYWVTAGLWHRVQHWPWNRHSWRRYVQVLTKKSKQTRKQKVKKKRKQMVTYSNKLASNWRVVMSRKIVQKCALGNACEFKRMIHSIFESKFHQNTVIKRLVFTVNISVFWDKSICRLRLIKKNHLQIS